MLAAIAAAIVLVLLGAVATTADNAVALAALALGSAAVAAAYTQLSDERRDRAQERTLNASDRTATLSAIAEQATAINAQHRTLERLATLLEVHMNVSGGGK